MCVSVCLSVREHISRTTCAIFTQFCMQVAYRRGSVLLRQGDKIPRERAIFGVFLPIDNALHYIAFRTHTKTAEPIEMPFSTMTRMGPKNHVLYGDADPQEKGAIFGGCPGYSKALTIFAAASLQRSLQKGIIQSQRHAADGIIQYSTQAQIVFSKSLGAGDAPNRPRNGQWVCTARAKSDIYDCLVGTL